MKPKFHEVVSRMLTTEHNHFLNQNVFGRIGSVAFKETTLVKGYRTDMMAAMRRELTKAIHPKKFGLQASLGGICGYLHATDRMLADSVYFVWDISDTSVVRVRVGTETHIVQTSNLEEGVRQIMTNSFQ